jgi:uncharacterized membrane-anchored protein
MAGNTLILIASVVVLALAYYLERKLNDKTKPHP